VATATNVAASGANYASLTITSTTTSTGSYPNPFNPSTEIEFAVEESGRATLEVFDLLGQKVATLFDGFAQSGYSHRVRFEAGSLSSGVYMYRLQSGGRSLTKKLLLSR
jgi:hypothetical protein